MAENVFLLRGGNTLTSLSPAGFENEGTFQHLLARFPDLLTNADFGEGEPRKWMLVSREIPVPAKEGRAGQWSLDHLFLDQDGVPTLVEVKRATDTRARREVVAQMLDYAANAVSWWRGDDLARLFEKTCAAEDVDPLERLNLSLGLSEQSLESFWRGVQANLTSGRIRMLFVADVIAPELERIVEFLNEQMNPATVLALELRCFSSGDERILAPRLIGVTSRASAQKSVGSSPQLTLEDWIAESSAAAQINRLVEELSVLGGYIAPAGRSLAVSPGPGLLRIAYIRLNGRVAISAWQLLKSPTFASEQSRIDLLKEVEATGFKLTNLNPKGEPSFELPRIDDAAKWRALARFFEQLFRRVKQ
jgi:hypothetical protein